MTDQDFIIRFRADVQSAIDQMNLLVTAAGAAEQAINKVQAAQAGGRTGNAMARTAQQAAAAFQGLGLDIADLEKRLQGFGGRFAAGVSNAVRRLPGALGNIEVFKNANQFVPPATLQEAIRGFRALETVYHDDTEAAKRFRIEAQALTRELILQSRTRIRSLTDQAQRASSRGDTRLEINSLRAAERELQRLQRAGVSVDRHLQQLRQRLINLGQPVRLGIRSEIEGLIPRIRNLRETAEARGLLGNQEGRLSTLKQLEELLTRLQVRGANVSSNLAAVRTQINAVSQAIVNATTAQSRQAILDRLQEKARQARENVLVANNTQPIQGQINALKKLEDALVRLRIRGVDTRAEITAVRQQIVNLAGAANNVAAIDKLLARRTKIEQQINQRADLGQAPSRLLELKAQATNLQLVARGYTQAASAAAIHQQRLAAMGPAINTEVAALLRQRDALLQSIRAREALNQKPTGGQLGRGLEINTRLADAAQRGGYTDIFKNASADVDRFSTAINANRGFLDQWTNAFGGHARRIAEGLIIYNAFGAALGGVRDSFALIANLDREMSRFEAVAGSLSETNADEFIRRLGETAVNTNTPLLQLISTTDQVAASFAGIGSPDEVAEATNAFQELAGAFSNVTGQQQDLVTTNLVALFRQTRREGESATEGLERFGSLLDIITTAGHNSSTIIAEIVNGLREAGPTAKATGGDFSVLAFALGQVVQETGESGLSVGNTLKTVLANLGVASKVEDVFGDVAGGIVQVQDASGGLLRSTDILINLFDAVEQGRLSVGSAQEIFRDLGPQLQPGQLGVVNAIFEAIGTGIQRMRAEMPQAQGALEDLSDTIVNSLGGRFERVIRRLEALIANGLLDPFVEAGETIVGVAEAIISVLQNPLGGAIIGTVAKVLTIATASLVVTSAFGKMGTIMTTLWARVVAGIVGGSTAAAAAMQGLGTAAGTTATGAGVAAGQMTLFGAAAGRASIGMRLFAVGTAVAGAALKTFLPFLVAMVAINVIEWATSAASEMERMGRVMEEIEGLEGSELEIAIESRRRGPILASIPGTRSAEVQDFQNRSTDIQDKNVDILREKLKELDEQGNLTAVRFRAMAAVILDSNGKIKTTAITTEQLDAALAAIPNDETQVGFENLDQATQDYINSVLDATEVVEELSAAEQRAAEALQINAGLTDERAAAIRRLNDDLAAGRITLDEYVQGQENVNSASEAASQFVATFADQLNLIPGLVERIAQTGESPGEALMNILLANPETIDEQVGLLQRMVDLVAATEEAVGETIISPNIDNEGLVGDVETSVRILGTVEDVTKKVGETLVKSPITPVMDNTMLAAQASEYVGILNSVGKAMATLQKGFSKSLGSLGKGGSASTSFDDILAELAEIGKGIGISGGIGPDDPRLGSGGSSSTNQTGIIDIGDLPPSQIAAVVAMATAAQARIKAAGGEVDDDDITALLANGQFQQLIKGVDQRLLTEALQQLTEVEKKRLELEQQRLQDVTRSLVTQVGPIQSLISSPVLGNQGGVLSGQGLNADPRLGNFTINVPINWSGMNLAQLQKYIYDTISKAWIDAGRGG
jgi:hypothetical protein